ncbi:MAG: Beta-agarase [Pedosphaera sp.]|nr:Beta-agarase [Pedosphaera sp.]
MMLSGAASAQTLQFRYAFADTGTTTTNDLGGPLGAIPLNIVQGNNITAVDRHGALGSGVQSQGYTLNLSTNPIAGNLAGAYAYTSNNAALGGLGIVSNFTVTIWCKMPALETNLLNQGGRLFGLMKNGVGDYGGVDTLGLQFGMGSGGATFPKNSMVGLISSAPKLTPSVYYDFPTNVWLFFALTYDSVSGNAAIYYGTEASPAKLYAVRPIGAGTNFNFSGTASFCLGNRLSGARSVAGWIGDTRFYTGTASAGTIEGWRQEATPLVVSGLTPDGSVLMSGTNTLSFTATSTNGVNTNGVKVSVNGADVSSSLSFSATAGGQIVTYTHLPVDSLLTAQTNLNGVGVGILITDAGGIVTSNRYVYDAFSPGNYTWEAEDYDYNSGGYTDNPTNAFNAALNPYYRAAGTPVTDYYDNGNGTGSPQVQVYRSISDLAATEYSLGAGANGGLSIGELMRQKVLDAYALGNVTGDVDAGFFDFGTAPGTPNWMNYTRTYPTNIYNVYIRVGFGGASGGSTLSQLTSGWGTSVQTTNVLGTFNYGNTGGWESYAWVPLRDSFGNLIQVSMGGTNTLKLTANTGGGGNVNFLMLTVANTNLPIVTAIYPNGTNIFQPASALTFNVSSPASFAIGTNSISVRLTVTNLVGLGFITNITSTNGLSFSGSATSWNVSCPLLLTNATYKAVISATDINGGPASATVSFEALSPSYTWDAEDYDYANGQYLDNPQTNSYAGLSGTSTVDYFSDSGTVPNASDAGPYYRTDGVSTQPNTDGQRLAYINGGLTDYNVGWFNPGNWCNYTRTYPTGSFNVYIRAADGNTTAGGAALAQVTSGWGTGSQTTTTLGSFSVTPTGGWQTYRCFPLRDVNGNLVQVSLGGTNTFRLTSSGALNANFLMLFPANTTLPLLSNVFPNGTNINQSTNTLGFSIASTAGVSTNAVVVTLNGVTVSNLVFSGSANNWNVSYPHLLPNTTYKATISITDVNGNVVLKNSTFNTFSAANYTWEAEDFDYNGGLWFDNPQTNAYTGVTSVAGVDFNDLNTGSTVGTGNHWTVYRPNGMETAINGDVVRPAYNGTGMVDYSVGFFATNEWMNFTRTYPAGTYNVYARMATSGATNSLASLSLVTSGWGTASQTTNYLGTFVVIPGANFEIYSYCPLTDAAGNLVPLTLNGSTNTLQVGRPDGTDINVNYLVLAPAFVLNATRSGGNILLSFPTQAGFNYQVQYKTNLTDLTWTPLGSAVSGNDALMSVPDPATGTSRFYRVQVQ